MGTFKWRSFALVPFYLFFFTLFTCNHSATSQGDSDICETVFCGMGTCHRAATLLGFRCDCESGWKKISLGPLELPACAIPNCTFDIQCGGKQPNPPSFLNLSNPCVLNFCGDGTCESKDFFNFTCQCNEGAANLLNNPKLPCFQKCAVGADCDGIDLGFGSPPPPPQNSGSSGTGLGEMPNCSRKLHVLTTMILATIFLN